MLGQTYRCLLLFVLGLTGLSSCRIPDEEPVIPKWQAGVIGPLVNAQLGIDDIFRAQGIEVPAKIETWNIGFPKGTKVDSINPIYLPLAPPFDLGEFINQFREATLSKSKIKIEIRNGFPMAIAAGTRLAMLSTYNQYLINHTITRDIPALGGTYTIEAELENATITTGFRFAVENFRTLKRNAPWTFNDEKLFIILSLQNIFVENLVLASKSRFDLQDTTDFKLPQNNGSTIAFDNGKLPIRIENMMPVRYVVQGYFLDAQKRVLDSLFKDGTFIIGAAQVDANGNLIKSVVSQNQLPLTEARLALLRRAEYFASKAIVQAVETTDAVPIAKTQTMNIRIFGDANLSFAPNH